jgi:hypothetical protein
MNGRDLGYQTVLREKKKRTGLEVAKVTEPGSLIIVLDDEMDKVDQKHSMTPPDVFFFGDRRGWYLSLAWVSSEKIEELRRKGAKYLVVSLQSVAKFKAEHEGLYGYLNRRFRTVAEQDGIVYALDAK